MSFYFDDDVYDLIDDSFLDNYCDADVDDELECGDDWW